MHLELKSQKQKQKQEQKKKSNLREEVEKVVLKMLCESYYQGLRNVDLYDYLIQNLEPELL